MVESSCTQQAKEIARFCKIWLTEEQLALYVSWRGQMPPEDNNWELTDQRLLVKVMQATNDLPGKQRIIESYPNIFDLLKVA